MSGLANKGADARRLVLGFDGGCGTCLALAKKVDEQVGDKLEVQNLRDPQLREWRKQALGEDAPWAPTLFEVEGGKVRAWTGKRMGVKLGRALGPVATWRVMQVLGEVGAPAAIEQSPVARVAAGMSRGQFLKGVGGAAVAMSVLSATGKMASPAQAASDVTEITGSELVEVARAMAGRKDMVNVMSIDWRDKVRDGRVIRSCETDDDDSERGCETIIALGESCRVTRGGEEDGDDGELRLSGNCAVVKATRREYANGNGTIAVSYAMTQTDRIVAYYEHDRARQGIETEANLWRIVGEGTTAKNTGLSLMEASHNRALDTSVPTMRQGDFTARPSDPCGGCDIDGPGDPNKGKTLREVCEVVPNFSCALGAASCGLSPTTCNPFTAPLCAGGVLTSCVGAALACCGGVEQACVECVTAI